MNRAERVNIPALVGQRFGRLVVVEQAFRRKGKCYWRCRCDCGGEAVTITSKLNAGHTKSCGCISRERITIAATTHGMSGTPEHWSWKAMKSRCLNPADHKFSYYGGRGITIAERWVGDNGFAAFYADMGPRPAGTTLDRIDPNGNYEPGNCKWSTTAEQARHRRDNHLITMGETTQTITDWASETGIDAETIRKRLVAGWSVDRALTTPARAIRRHVAER